MHSRKWPMASSAYRFEVRFGWLFLTGRQKANRRFSLIQWRACVGSQAALLLLLPVGLFA